MRALRRVRRAQRGAAPRKLHQHIWVHGLPLKMRFRKSRLYISAMMPIGIGFVVGILSALLGVGGAFLMVPAMIYLLGMPTSIVVGTSLFQIIFVAANTTILQSMENHTVDVLLAFVLTIGGVIGAQFGGRIGARLPGEQIRFLLALLILSVARRPLLHAGGDAGGSVLPAAPAGEPMMRALSLLALIAAALAGLAAPAAAKGIVADVDDHLVEITTDFAGQDILVFGAIDGPGDVILVMRGPAGRVAVHQKDRFAGIWVNAESIEFDDVPSLYGVASSRPLFEILPNEMLDRYQLGVGRLRFETAGRGGLWRRIVPHRPGAAEAQAGPLCRPGGARHLHRRDLVPRQPAFALERSDRHVPDRRLSGQGGPDRRCPEHAAGHQQGRVRGGSLQIRQLPVDRAAFRLWRGGRASLAVDGLAGPSGLPQAVEVTS